MSKTLNLTIEMLEKRNKSLLSHTKFNDIKSLFSKVSLIWYAILYNDLFYKMHTITYTKKKYFVFALDFQSIQEQLNSRKCFDNICSKKEKKRYFSSSLKYFASICIRVWINISIIFFVIDLTL